MPVPPRHHVLPASLSGPFPDGSAYALFGMGCFWGAERKFWLIPGVISTAVGYAGGHTPNPTYEEVCSGLTGHTEVVRVVFDPARVHYEALLRTFWETHDPTQGMRQGNDVGTQYRSLLGLARRDAACGGRGIAAGVRTGAVARGVRRHHHRARGPAPTFYFAEAYHQQYLHTHPNGYCGLGGTQRELPDRRRGEHVTRNFRRPEFQDNSEIAVFPT